MRPMTLAAALLIFPLAGSPIGQSTPGGLRAEIGAPVSIAAGRIVRLEAKLIREREHVREELQPSDDLAPRFAWRLISPPAGYEIGQWTFDGGRTVVFAAAEPGQYRFVLAAACPDVGGGAPELLLAEHTLIVGTVPPAPAPQPLPSPQPVPDLPEGRYGLSRVIRELVLAEVPVQERSRAAALARNYRAVQSQIAAGALTESAAILAATAEGNRAALGISAEAWRLFFTALAARMQSLDAAGRIAAPEDYATAWSEIALGLDAVR